MANNFIKDFLGFGVPDIYSGIFKDPKQLEELNTQGLKRGATFGLLNYLTQPKNQNYGSALPYIGQAVGTGLQAYQGTLDAGLANALKAKALETDDIPKIGAINAGDYTVESLANYQKTKNLADLVKKPDATTTKGMTDAEIMQLETAFPGFKADEQTKALLRTDRTQGLDLFKQKYTTKAEMIYDTNMSTFGSAKQKIDDALDAGRGVEINYVYRDPVEALKNGSLTRAKNQSAKWGTGRTVPLKEHLKTHAGARDVIEKVAKEYFDDPRVKIRLIDNSGVKSKPVTFDKLPKIDENKVSKELKEALDDMYKNNIITKEIYEGSK